MTQDEVKKAFYPLARQVMIARKMFPDNFFTLNVSGGNPRGERLWQMFAHTILVDPKLVAVITQEGVGSFGGMIDGFVDAGLAGVPLGQAVLTLSMYKVVADDAGTHLEIEMLPEQTNPERLREIKATLEDQITGLKPYIDVTAEEFPEDVEIDKP